MDRQAYRDFLSDPMDFLADYMRPDLCEEAVLGCLGESLKPDDHRYGAVIRDIWYEYLKACHD